MTLPVSVVIPCFKCLGTIERALNSIAKQSCLPCEVIMVEDKSPDNNLTYLGLKSIKEKFEGILTIKLIQLDQNSGPASARNAGLKLAIGDYVAFLDADDSWHPQKLELQYLWMKNNYDIFITGHDLKIIDSQANQIESSFELKKDNIFKINKINILFRNQFSTPTIMLKNNFNIFFREGESAAEDYYLWLKLILINHKAYKFSLPLAYSYKEHFGEAGLSSNLWKMELGELRCYFQIYKDGLISLPVLPFLSAYSLLKFLRRVFIVKFLR